MSKAYFSYTRVSTARQGQAGTSLEQQREAIQTYAKRWSLNIVREFEEKETAAKAGRPVFLQMLSELKQGKASGVIIHKIDRSARNLRDWADLGDAIDGGIDVHFANENLDLESRGGRLSADIQAVVAADYIRNLREEVKKGFYGRLKQGFYPMPAPIGYLDQGAAKPKAPDPIRAPLVRKMFELYGSESYSISHLVETMYDLGLRTKTGKKITKNSVAHILHNPFYVGLMRVKCKNELFIGRHKPIISRELFDQVQVILQGKNPKRPPKHEFVYRRLLVCSACQIKLIGELQKGWIYYRCHNRSCPQKTIRQEAVERAVLPVLRRIKFTELENRYLRQEINKGFADMAAWQESYHQSLKFQRDALRRRLLNLTDAYIDGVVDKETYTEKKNLMLLDEQQLNERLGSVTEEIPSRLQQVQEILELANNAYLSYEMAVATEKRELLQCITSNLSVRDKTLSIMLKYPFQIIANRKLVPNGGPQRDTTRTLSALVKQLFKYFASRKTEDEEVETYKPVPIISRRLKLAFRRANAIGPEKLAA